MRYFQCISLPLGSIPSAVWIGKQFHNIDVREHGSGNAGTTNTIRVLGWTTGIPVLLIDITKGWLASMLPVFFHLAGHGSALLTNLQILTGIIAIIGHIFPVFAGFREERSCNCLWCISGFTALAYYMLYGRFSDRFIYHGIVSVSSMSAGNSFPGFPLSVF